MYDTATNTDMFYVEGVIFEPLDPYIGSSGDPRGMGSHNDFMIHDSTGNSIKVRIKLVQWHRNLALRRSSWRYHLESMLQMKMWGSTMGSSIDMLDAALAARPNGVVVKAFAFGRDSYEGYVSLKSMDQSQLHVCHESEITMALSAVGKIIHVYGNLLCMSSLHQSRGRLQEIEMCSFAPGAEHQRQCSGSARQRAGHSGHGRCAHEHCQCDDDGHFWRSFHQLSGAAGNGEGQEGRSLRCQPRNQLQMRSRLLYCHYITACIFLGG